MDNMRALALRNLIEKHPNVGTHRVIGFSKLS